MEQQKQDEPGGMPIERLLFGLASQGGAPLFSELAGRDEGFVHKSQGLKKGWSAAYVGEPRRPR